MKVLIYSFCIVFSRRHRVLPSITAMSTARTLRIYSEEDPDLRVVLPERRASIASEYEKYND